MDALLGRLACCCVAEQAGHAELQGLSHAGAWTSEAAYSAASSAPHLPLEGDARGATPLGGNAGAAGGITGGDKGGFETPASPSEAEYSVTGSGMSFEEKEYERARLHQLVKDFAKEAIRGIAVSLVHPETSRRSAHFFQMDRYLTVFSLKPKDGSTAQAPVQDFNVKDLTHIYKGMEVCMKAPRLGTAAALCVGLDTNRADQRLFFYFDEALERDRFYTCLKILRMSVDISGGSGTPT